MTTFIQARLTSFIEHVREDHPSGGAYHLPDSDRVPLGEPPLVIGLARFQSYRGRTQAALLEELEEWVETANIGIINFKVLDEESTVILW